MTEPCRARRRILRAGLASASLFLPSTHALVWAQQSDGALKLLRLPKMALVIGNSAYKDAPVLKNPANDAKAIGESLTEAGFGVTLMLDGSRSDMLSAIQKYSRTLAEKKCVGLFYFAGHGLQLAWKNYLLPIDAVVDKIDDVPRQGVDVATLMQSLTKAENALNVIILDACRENPFGKNIRVDEKGLSQMDAPVSTLLAYATSPGNVASDGSGANGLYTENLLREIRVKEAKIEDVFKRVRLAVRRKSSGAQIPWESTSLEDDFYFLPPEKLQKLSEEERLRLYKEELAIWDTVKNATQPGPLENFLRIYPNGSFSELAQFQLNRVLAMQGEKPIQIVAAAGNPYTKGSSTSDTKYAVGDSYAYRVTDILTQLEQAKRPVNTVTQVTSDRVIFSSGLVTDLLGNELEFPNGAKFSAFQRYPLEYAVGKRWVTRFEERQPRGDIGLAEYEMHIAAREKITVPAGTFDAFRVEGKGFVTYTGLTLQTTMKIWMAPDQVRRPVATEVLRKNIRSVYMSERSELTSFKQA